MLRYLAITLIAMSAFAQQSHSPATNGLPPVAPDLNAQLAKWRPVKMPFDAGALAPAQRQMVEKLVDASQDLDDIFWRQSDPDGLELLKRLGGSTNPLALKIRRMLIINGSRFDLLDNNAPFVGAEPYSPDCGLYPRGLTRQEIEQYVRKRPAQKSAIYSPYTIIRRKGSALDAIPYAEAYKPFLERAAGRLREAAALSDDAAFARFLRMRADALLSDNYYPSDLAWLDLKTPKIDVIFAPYETYLDDVLGVKTSYGAAVLIRNDAASRKLAIYEQFIPQIQDALPVAANDRPPLKGRLSPMEVVDSPFRAGDLRHGYQAVADNLPNDPRIHAEKGTKKIFFKNFMDARVTYVILPLAWRLMEPQQAAEVSGEGYLACTILHEISHGLGPAFARVNGQQADIRTSIGPIYSGLEEAKADVVGMYGLQWLSTHGALPPDELNGDYASYLAGLFRTLRYGIAEAHGQAEMMEFNYLVEQGAIRRNPATQRYYADFAKMPATITNLAKILLEIEATGDRGRAEAWFKRYDVMPPDLTAALKNTRDIPVDVDPIFSFKAQVE
ncbi:MAG: Zn-dependent hydrolase [Terriglobia bacterium]